MENSGSKRTFRSRLQINLVLYVCKLDVHCNNVLNTNQSMSLANVLGALITELVGV